MRRRQLLIWLMESSFAVMAVLMIPSQVLATPQHAPEFKMAAITVGVVVLIAAIQLITVPGYSILSELNVPSAQIVVKNLQTHPRRLT